MIIGVPKEVKNHEYRVGLTPESVSEFSQSKHMVLVEDHAGDKIGFTNMDYIKAGAKIIKNSEEIFKKADMIIKVKEPRPKECRMLNQNQLIFTYLHLAADPLQTELLLKSKCTAIAYEMVTDKNGGLPLLSPMSEIAGRLSVQAGAHCLEKMQGGSGILLGGVPGVQPGQVLVIGGGVVGSNAIKMAVGMGANVTVLDRSLSCLRKLDHHFGNKINCIYPTKNNLEKYVQRADLIIGAVLVPGSAAPKIITKDMILSMKKGSVIVDVAIDQGGCFETSKATTHENPTYTFNDIVHYCVTNMPGAVSRTSTIALNNATLPFALELANKGYKKAIRDNINLENGLSIHNGILTSLPVAQSLHIDYTSPKAALSFK